MADDAPAAAPVIENGVPPAEHAVESTVDDTPGHKVFAGNLAYSVTDDGLKAFFAPVESDILTAQVIMRRTRTGPRSAGYGFVALATEEAAHKAVELLNGTELDGRQVIVEVAKPADQKDKERPEKKARRRPGRRGSKAVPGEVTEAEANGHVEKPEGETGAEGEQKKPKKKKSPRKKTRKASAKSEGEGEAPTTDAAPAEEATPSTNGDAAAHEDDGAAPKKKTPRPRRPARPSRPAGEDPVGEPSKTMLFVANLNFNVDDAALAQIFTDAGIVVNSARVVRRRWGNPRKSKGYGFVDVGTEEEQKKAIEALSGKELDGGRAIAVKVAVNTPEGKEETEETEEAHADATEQPAEAAEVAAETAPAL